MSEPNFPVLGQALPIELANTLFFRGGQTLEGLASVGDAREWVELNADTVGIRRSDVDESCRRALRELRGPVRELLAARVEARQPKAAALAAINAASARCPLHVELVWPRRGPQAAYRRSRGKRTVDELRATVAAATALFLAREEASRLRACPAPGCIGFFVKDHARREWCSIACGNRARNARFHRRHRKAGRRTASAAS